MIGGPVLLFDAVNTARRFRLGLLRALYLGFLFLILCVVYLSSVSHNPLVALQQLFEPAGIAPQRIDQFTSSFTFVFLTTQHVVLVLLTPLLTVGAMADERQNNRLALLLTTQLSSADIVLGKVLSRLGHVMLLLLAGLPLLSLLLFLGGVEPSLLIVAYCFTFLTICSAASLSVLTGVENKTHGQALFAAYFGLIVLTILGVIVQFARARITPFTPPGIVFHAVSRGVMVEGSPLFRLSATGQLANQIFPLLLSMLAFHGLLSAACLLRAMRLLGKLGADEVRPSPMALPIVDGPIQSRLAVPTLPPVTEHPVHWLITVRPRRYLDSLGIKDNGCAIAVIGILVLTALFVARSMPRPRFPIGPPSRMAMVDAGVLTGLLCVCTFLFLVFLITRATGTIAVEREQQTLETLLTTDLTNREVLVQKWLAIVEPGNLFSVMLVVAPIPGLLVRAYTIPQAMLIAPAVMGQVAFVTCAGMYFSLVCTTRGRAVTATLIVSAVGVLLHALVHLAIAPVGHGPAWLLGSLASLDYLNPLRVGQPVEHEGLRLLAALTGQLVYPVLAGLLWWRLSVRFGPVTGRLS